MILYDKAEWFDESDTTNARIPISAFNLNRMEDGINSCVGYINKMYTYWWKKSKVIGGDVLFSSIYDYIYFYLWDNTTTTTTVYYASSVTVKVDDSTGEVYAELDNYRKSSLSYSNFASSSLLNEKYFIIGSSSNKSGEEIYYCSGSCYEKKNSYAEHPYGFYTTNTYRLSLSKIYGDVEYVNSADINMYPNGWSNTDIALYEYLGIPFENSRESCSILTGWYCGNGTEERLIKTGCKPKCVLLFKDMGDESYLVDYAPYCYGFASETFSFGNISVSDDGFVIGTDKPSTNYIASKYAYIVFY